MSLVKELTACIEKIAPLSLQEHYDNSGLLIGSPEMQISGVLIALDVTEEVIEEAVAQNCNVIIAHHPFIFNGIKKITGSNYVERCIIKSIQNNLAIYACHTNLDNVEGGVNFKIAEKIGIQAAKILSPKTGVLKKLITYCPIESTEKVQNALFEAGAGAIGNYSECGFITEGMGTFKPSDQADPVIGLKNKRNSIKEQKIEVIFPSYLQNKIFQTLKEAHPYEEVAYNLFTLDNTHQMIGSGIIGELAESEDEMTFLTRLKTIFEVGSVRFTKSRQKPIKRIAVCGGSGSFLLKEAISAGADIFISADFKYHQFFDAENRILIADIGHYESEQFTKELLYDVIRKNFSNFAVRFTKINTNPINYL